MKFGMSIIVRGPDCGRETFEAMAAKAEETGLDALWVSDHLVIPALKTSRYPGRADGSTHSEGRCAACRANTHGTGTVALPSLIQLTLPHRLLGAQLKPE